MAKRAGSSAQAKDLAKIFRGFFGKPLTPEELQADWEECLERHMDFFVDLWKADMYPTETVLQQGVSLAWPKVGATVAKQIAKSVKTVLSTLHYKRRRLTSGQKSPKVLGTFLKEVAQPQLPLATGSSSSNFKQPVPAKSAAEKPTSQTIAAMYGLSNNSKDFPVSQVTISDCVEEALVVSDSQEEATCEASYGYYYDYQDCCLVRTKNGQTERSTMKPGKDGFAEAVFSDGMVRSTEIANMELFCLKKPATCLKRPAAALQEDRKVLESAGEDAVSEIEDDSAELEAAKPMAAKPHDAGGKNFTFQCGIAMKLGLFTGQSYITYKEPGMAKFTLLVACSCKMASRNGKDHHAVMQAIWDFVKSLPAVPSKHSSKQLLLDMLAEK